MKKEWVGMLGCKKYCYCVVRTLRDALAGSSGRTGSACPFVVRNEACGPSVSNPYERGSKKNVLILILLLICSSVCSPLTALGQLKIIDQVRIAHKQETITKNLRSVIWKKRAAVIGVSTVALAGIGYGLYTLLKPQDANADEPQVTKKDVENHWLQLLIEERERLHTVKGRSKWLAQKALDVVVYTAIAAALSQALTRSYELFESGLDAFWGNEYKAFLVTITRQVMQRAAFLHASHVTLMTAAQQLDCNEKFNKKILEYHKNNVVLDQAAFIDAFEDFTAFITGMLDDIENHDLQYRIKNSLDALGALINDVTAQQELVMASYGADERAQVLGVALDGLAVEVERCADAVGVVFA